MLWSRDPGGNRVLAEGTVAPEFTLPDQNGSLVSLTSFRGRWLVFWWFPKAFTDG
jgi:peroxiredoxin Q/BCP